MNGSPALFVERGPLVREALVSGVSIADAAREHDVSVGTVKGWLRRGRDDPGSRYGPFARAVDEAMAERAMPPAPELPADEAELRLLASKAARSGNVQAMRLLFEMLRSASEPADESDPLADLDELARRRMKATGA
jgi:transposase-like protein